MKDNITHDWVKHFNKGFTFTSSYNLRLSSFTLSYSAFFFTVQN